jgi:PadR family transcriptional regulator
MSTIGDLTLYARSGCHAPTEANAPYAEIRDQRSEIRDQLGAPSFQKRPVAFPKKSVIFLLETKMARPKTEVQQGTLALMVLKTLDVLGPVHGYGIARRIEQISGDLLAVNQGTLYPVLLKLEQEGAIASEWGTSENNRKARFYRLTRAGRKQLRTETEDWEQTSAIIARFFTAKAEDLA